ncbi:hypothetical protein N0V94_007565 [Neodidymelliopsis sp. IMI 364377]|nr:hypothetical protein N0V94_007565 [Neodidymelliopsis sp. IMI 364377]
MLAKNNDQMVASERMFANTVYMKVMKALDCLADGNSIAIESRDDTGACHPAQEFTNTSDNIGLPERAVTTSDPTSEYQNNDSSSSAIARTWLEEPDDMVRKDTLRKGLSDTGVAQEVTMGAAPRNAQSAQRISPDSGKSLWANVVTRPLNPTGKTAQCTTNSLLSPSLAGLQNAKSSHASHFLEPETAFNALSRGRYDLADERQSLKQILA